MTTTSKSPTGTQTADEKPAAQFDKPNTYTASDTSKLESLYTANSRDVGDEMLDIEASAPPAIALEPASSRVLDVIGSHVSRPGEDDPENEDGSPEKKPKRRTPIGTLHRFCYIKELENPYEYSPLVKNLLIFIFAFAGMVPAMGSAVFYPAVNDIASEFNTDLTVINLSVGFYMISLGVFPLWWSYFSETGGRRGVYLVSFLLFALFNVGCAKSTSIGMLIAFRILAGGAAASSQTVGAGAIGDIYIPTERGRANSYFYLGPLCGPMIAPIISGALVDRWGWRSTQYFLIIIGLSSWLMMFLFLPETLRPQVVPAHIAEKRAAAKEAGKAKYYLKETWEFFIGPFKAFLLLQHPSFLFAISYNSFTYGCLYMINNTIPDLFTLPPYNFSSVITGLMYLPNGLGYMCGSLIGGRWSDHIIKRSVKKNNGTLVPEARLAENMVFAGIVVCVGMILYGWTADKHLFWFVPIIGTFMFGFGSLIIFTTTLTFLVDSMPKRRSAAASINTFIRCITAGVSTFITVPLKDAMGIGWLFTMIMFMGLIFLALQFYVKKKGPEWRAKMNMEVG